MFDPFRDFSAWARGLSLAVALAGLSGTEALAQFSVSGDKITARVRAQADLIRAQGQLQTSAALARREFAQAAKVLVEAASAEADLEMKLIDNYWKKKRRNNLESWNALEERIENARKPMVLENARRVAVWERTIEGELSKARPAIRTGSLLNRIAREIDRSTGLSSSYTVSADIASRLAVIDDESLERLNVIVSSLSGPISVSLAGPLPPIFERWPYLFRDPKLQPHREKLTALGNQLMDPKTTDEQRFLIDRSAREGLAEASSAFYRLYPPTETGSRASESRRIILAEQYLEELERTISNLAEASPAGIQRPSYYEEYPAGSRNAASLVQYMNRYGLEFGRARPGTEFLYDRLFLQLRDLAHILNSAPQRDSITEPMINLDLDAAVSDPNDQQ